MRNESLCWVHVGDLHITDAQGQNYRDLIEIVDVINEYFAVFADFCVLPGDNADDGTPEQYALIRSVVQRLKIPLHVIPGDHDFKQGSLSSFYDGLGGAPLPKSLTVKGHRCLFLDAVSEGGGGPDFHLGDVQHEWLTRELGAASASRQPSVIFVHAYPADFPRDRERFARLLQEYRVRVVDMGHTHYNELANDGTTLFATTRSTGQIEEGLVGFSVVTLSEGIVNWRFKPLASPWPFVMITSPGDHRLQTDGVEAEACDIGGLCVSARAASSARIVNCRYRIDEGTWQELSDRERSGEWTARDERPGHRFSLTVEATDSAGSVGTDRITVAEPGYRPPSRAADGSDADAVDVWPERHLLGTRLGPNRNGKQW